MAEPTVNSDMTLDQALNEVVRQVEAVERAFRGHGMSSQARVVDAWSRMSTMEAWEFTLRQQELRELERLQSSRRCALPK
jgi:hypothetical protein